LFNAAALTPGRPVVLCEGEFDAMAVSQAAGDLAAAVASGSTTGARAARWLYALAAAPCVLVAFDADPAGAEAAGWWLSRLPNAKRLRPVGAKDPSDMHPERLRTWVAEALGMTAPAGVVLPFPPGWRERFTCEQLERLAVRTVDAGLSDADALTSEGLSG
jgi:DNA primase